MELNEAITELEEHGYLLNEWKATPITEIPQNYLYAFFKGIFKRG